MTNINPDNLKKGEPYLIINSIDCLYLGFFVRHENKRLYFENDVLIGTMLKEEKNFHVSRIKSITPLKPGEVIK